jgi:hypothetical protein
VNWKRCIHLWGVILGLGFGSTAMAQVPGVFHFSGQLDTNNGALTDTIDVQFALYDDPVLGGETHLLWTEMQTVAVTQGRFHVLLGTDEINPILPSVFQKAAVYVGITVGGDSEMTPRHRVGTVPYASLAGDAATLGGVSASSYVTQDGLDDAGYVTGGHTTDTDTQLSSNQVLTMVSDGGYYTGAHTTDTVRSNAEIQSVVGAHTVDTTRSNAEILSVVGAHTTDTNTQLSSSQVLTMVSDGGYVTGGHTTNTNTQLSSSQVLTMVSNGGHVTGAHTVDTFRSDEEIKTTVAGAGYVAGAHTVNTNTQLSSNQVLTMVSNGGYVTGGHTTNTQLSSSQVLTMVSNGGFLSSENDPQVGPLSLSYVPRWDGNALKNSNIYAGSNGKIGIGVTAPVNRLDIEGGDLSVHGAGGHSIRLFDKGDTNHRIYYSGATNSVHIDSYSQIYFNQGFYTPGNVGIGTSSPTSRLHVAGGCISGYFCSDARLKTHIRPLDESVLDRITQLEVSTYQWKHSPDDGTRIGLIAQQVERVFPEIVSTGDNGEQKGLSCTGLNAVLVEAVKEQQQQIDKLQTRLNAIEKRHP